MDKEITRILLQLSVPLRQNLFIFWGDGLFYCKRRGLSK